MIQKHFMQCFFNKNEGVKVLTKKLLLNVHDEGKAVKTSGWNDH